MIRYAQMKHEDEDILVLFNEFGVFCNAFIDDRCALEELPNERKTVIRNIFNSTEYNESMRFFILQDTN